MASRTYRQTRRAEAAEQTRQRVIEAVQSHLRARPAEKLSLDAVARDAAVARSTIYEIFGSRAGLFQAAAQEAYDRTGYAKLVAAGRHDDALEQLRGGLRAATRMHAGERDIFRALYSMYALDPEAVGGVIAGIDEERGAGMSRIARRLDEQGYLAAGMTRSKAAHLLWVITSFESFDALYTGRALSTARCVELLVEMAERAVIKPASG